MSTLDFENTLRLYGNDVFKIAYTYCKNKDDAEDIVQNVFLKLYLGKEHFNNSEHIKKWLMKVAINESKNLLKSAWYRKRQNNDEVLLSYESTESSENKVLNRDEFSEIYLNVMNLPEKYRAVIFLYYYEEYTIKEIAEIISVRESNVQTRLLRARKKLKEVLKED